MIWPPQTEENLRAGMGSAEARRQAGLKFGAVQAVKELARERVGAPPVEKVVPHKNKKAERHKPTLGKMLENED